MAVSNEHLVEATRAVTHLSIHRLHGTEKWTSIESISTLGLVRADGFSLHYIAGGTGRSSTRIFQDHTRCIIIYLLLYVTVMG